MHLREARRQIASWDDQTLMVAWAALVYEPKGAKQPTLGTLEIEASTSVSFGNDW